MRRSTSADIINKANKKGRAHTGYVGIPTSRPKDGVSHVALDVQCMSTYALELTLRYEVRTIFSEREMRGTY